MIVTTLFTKRIISSLRCSFPVSTNNISCFANKLNIINSQRINHLVRQQQQQQQQQHRHLSSSSSSSNTQRLSKRRQAKQKVSQQQQQQQQHDDDDENFKPIPRWPAVVSMLIVPVMFAAWGASDWFFGNKIKGINEGLRKEFIAAATITANHQKANNYNYNDDDDDDDDYYLTVLEKKPTLFHCVIRRDTGFIHCLSGVQLLDVVEVLEVSITIRSFFFFFFLRKHVKQRNNMDEN